MKLVYRILILVGIFAGSLWYFGSHMNEKVFSIEQKTMEMEDATLPYMSLLVENQMVNLLHGYCSGLDVLTVRENITPLTADQSFSVMITENESIVKKVKYEVIQLEDGKTFEEGSINALDKEEAYKVARIKLKEPLVKDAEYVLRITLITDKSKRIYFYTRIKVMDKTNLAEKLAFVQDFHKATLNKDSADDISKYLEKPSQAAASFSKVTIYNDIDSVMYGELEPSVIYEGIPTVTEISKDTASVVLEFILSIQTSTGLENYRVKEEYRFMYTPTRCYLYDYNRKMESIFDVSLASLSKNEFKLGITSDPDVELVSNTDDTTLAFVRQGVLWSYSLVEKNKEIVEVFSFNQENTDYVRDTFANHDIKILNMDNTGNIDFIVYGYMNRGEYEGRVGIILYHFDKVLNRVQEQIYIPINTTYEILKEEIGDFCYKNAYDVFYIHIFDTIYSYNLTTKALKVIASGVPKESLIYSKKGKFIAYQELNGEQTAPSIHVLALEEGTEHEIKKEDNIRLLGLIDQNIVYGIAPDKDKVISMDGTVLYPMPDVLIANSDGVTMKRYHKDGYYIIDAKVAGNKIELERIVMKKDSAVDYEYCDPDYILNTATSVNAAHKVTKRVTDMMLTEYYISLNATLEVKPHIAHTVNTVITEDTTVRINRPESDSNQYIAYAFGNITALTKDAGEAIIAADEASGIVLNSQGKLVWERGVKTKKSAIDGIHKIDKSENKSSLQACLSMLLQYKNAGIDASAYKVKEMSVMSFLDRNLSSTPVKAEGITLDEAFYFIYKKRPVIAFKGSGEAVLMIAYDSSSVTILDPANHSERKLSLKEASKLFDEAGNVFITYID